MKRRKFIKLSGLAATGAMFLNGHAVRPFAKTTLLNNLPADLIDGRALVFIQLKGGNDGLNTLIPYNQYDTYANLRPTIKINNLGETNGGIMLDSTLPNEQQVLLHPSLVPFKTLYDEGKLNIVQGVGYPFVNKSHFAAQALMLKGGDGTVENAHKESGWMARFLENKYDFSSYQDPLGIQLGSKKPSLGFHSSNDAKVDVNLSGQDISGYYSILSNLGNTAFNALPSSDYGLNIHHVDEVAANANSYSQRISQVFDSGSNLYSYPDTDLSDQLKTVAKMIKGGSKTKIFLVHLDGFDNHSKQVEAGASHLGKHNELLTDLSNAVLAFQRDLELMGLEDKVITSTFTEFGRKPKENGNHGTDHGNLGPMFVIGKHVNPGIIGDNLALDYVTKHYDETKLNADYRQTFTTLITDFLGASSTVVQQTEFENYGGANKLALIAPSQIADQELSVNNPSEFQLKVFPNPIEANSYVSFISDSFFRGSFVVYDLQLKLHFKIPQDFTPGIKNYNLDFSSLKTGVYLLKVMDDNHSEKAIFKIFKH